MATNPFFTQGEKGLPQQRGCGGGSCLQLLFSPQPAKTSDWRVQTRVSPMLSCPGRISPRMMISLPRSSLTWPGEGVASGVAGWYSTAHPALLS